MAAGKGGGDNDNQEQLEQPSYQSVLKTLKKNDLTLREYIGEGGFGEVRKGQHIHHGDVAVKICKKELWENKGIWRRITEEVRRMTDASFTMYVVRILGIIEPDKDTPCWIVMEYMKFGSLQIFREKLDRVIPADLRVYMLYEMSLGMGYLHDQNPAIIHRDLKLANVFLDLGYRVKIGDLGLATVNEDGQDSEQVACSDGTVSHMPPERDVTVKWDVFSFGITTWELSTGYQPFHECGDETALIKYGISTGQRPDWTLVPDNELVIIKELMEKSWHQEPDQRPTFKDILAKLKDYIGGPSDDFNRRVDQDRKALTNIRELSGSWRSSDEADVTPRPAADKGDSGEMAPAQAAEAEGPKFLKADAQSGLHLEFSSNHSRPLPLQASNGGGDSPRVDLLRERLANFRLHDQNVMSPLQESARQDTEPSISQNSSQMNPAGTQWNQSHNQFTPTGTQWNQLHNQFTSTGTQWNQSHNQFTPTGTKWNLMPNQYAPTGTQSDSFKHQNIPLTAKFNPHAAKSDSMAAQSYPSGSQISSPMGAKSNLVGNNSAPSAVMSIRDPHELVTEELLNKLNSHIGKRYNKLGRALGLQNATVENIEADKRGDQEEIGFSVMMKWMQATEYPSRLALAQALAKAELMEVVRKM